MLHTRRNRRTLCTWMVGVLLAVQWLVSAYACSPGVHARGLPAVPDEAPAAAHAGCDSGSHEMSSGDAGSLCKAHCTANEQLPAQPASDDLPAPTLGWFIVSTTLGGAPATSGWTSEATPRCGAPPGWPPLYLLHQVLRN